MFEPIEVRGTGRSTKTIEYILERAKVIPGGYWFISSSRGAQVMHYNMALNSLNVASGYYRPNNTLFILRSESSVIYFKNYTDPTLTSGLSLGSLLFVYGDHAIEDRSLFAMTDPEIAELINPKPYIPFVRFNNIYID